MILVSACLLGVNCKYNGKNNFNKEIVEFLKDKNYMIICPEQLGGLTTPRKPAEIKNGSVILENGISVNENFLKGAEETLNIAKLVKAEYAILKNGSPSCGKDRIYDGNFNGVKIIGSGITARKLLENNIKIYSEMDFKEIK